MVDETKVPAGAQESGGLTRYLSPFNVWALSLGCSIGWGAFVMPATTLLPKAGPVGAVVGMLVAALAIMIIAVSFHYMLNRYPDSGGAFTFTKKVLGYDHAFLCAWALILAYVAIMWANATALILISRFLLGDVFQFGFHYVVAGYDVYFGEILVTLAVLAAFGLFASANKRLVNTVNTVLAFVLFFGVVLCFVLVLLLVGSTEGSFQPQFAPGNSPVAGVFGIAALAPWAFLGFESAAHTAGETAFPHKKMLGIMVAAVACGAFIYIAMTLVSVMAIPDGYDNWAAYIGDLGNHPGLSGLPTFNAMHAALGQAGVVLLAVVVLAAISTTLIGLYRTGARLMYAVAQEEVLPHWFTKLNKNGVPGNAILAIMAVSVLVPFVGRAAIGWIVDVTSVSASIVYGYAAMCAYKLAKEANDAKVKGFAVAGIAISAVFLVFPLVPNVWTVSALAPESYLILAAWSITGLVLFLVTFKRDKVGRFGHSVVVWVMMVLLILFSSTMWMRQVTYDGMSDIVAATGEYYAEEFADRGIELSDEDLLEEEQHLDDRVSDMRDSLLSNSFLQTLMILISLVPMVRIYAMMRKREREHDRERASAEEASQAKTAFLSNMSHDIRTPMNAIIGYTHLAQREGTSDEEIQRYLEKIDGSSKHLLALINDVLEMSRIESGKMELDPTESDICQLVDEVRDMFATQMQEKGIVYTVDARGVRNRHVMLDSNRMNRVLLNLVSNAYKFTPEGGAIDVTLAQTSDAIDGRASYELRVRDTGIGMTPEFAEHVFEAFERERSATVSGIQGTGLGMAITKNIVEAMGGDIRVITELGEGTEFVIDVALDVCDEGQTDVVDAGAEVAEQTVDFTGKKLLLVEDNEINREIAMLILEEAGFVIDTAENGQIAVDKVSASQPGDYDMVLMDVQMPVMDGYEATRCIRALDDPQLSSIPIVAASANAFAEDIQNAREAGMDGHVAKPLDVDNVMRVLADVLKG